MNTRAYEVKDAKLRKQIIELSNRQCSNEHLLLSFCIENQHEFSLIKKYLFIVDFNFEIRIDGVTKGEIDLLLTDGKSNHLNVEFKFLPVKSGKRNRSLNDDKRYKVYQQATKNRELLQTLYPNDQFGCYVITNELLKNNKQLYEKFKQFRERKKEIRDKRARTLFSKLGTTRIVSEH